jgi:acetolactate synthase-1/2/3 large subunit
MNGAAALIALNAEAGDLARNRPATVALLADARVGLAQLTERLAAREPLPSYADWTGRLAAKDRAAAAGAPSTTPIHPQWLCAELEKIRDRDAVVILDGAAILDFGRRILKGYRPGRYMTPGVFGTMGVGVPFAVGAKVAVPDAPVVVLTGDGAFGYHAMELDTAVRHGLPFLVVVANNGGWTAKRGRPGYALNFSDYQDIATALGCFGARVTDPAQVGPTLRAALDYMSREGKPALVNVVISTDRLSGRSFSRHARQEGAEYDAV